MAYSRERAAAQKRAWYLANREKAKAATDRYIAANADRIKENATKRRLDPSMRAKRIAWCKAWRVANPEKQAAACRTWTRNNPERVAAHGAKRRAARLGNAADLSPPVFEELRNECHILELLTGESWQIDHIVPLSRGGAHSEDNLRLLPARLNNIKHAKLDHEVTHPDFIHFLKAA